MVANTKIQNQLSKFLGLSKKTDLNKLTKEFKTVNETIVSQNETIEDLSDQLASLQDSYDLLEQRVTNIENP